MKPTICAAVAAACLVAGCKDDKDKLAPAASALAPAPAVPRAIKMTIDPKSATTLSLEAPQEKIKATTDGAAGEIDLDVRDVRASRGEVKIDLTTLRTRTFGVEAKDRTQTTHARTWLEVADGEEGPLDATVKEANRWAVYAIRAVERTTADDVTAIAPTRDGADEVRSLTVTTRGELLVHGRKVDRDAEVALELRYEPGAAADKPKELRVRSTKPLRVVLAEHDVKPRDGFGKIAKGSFSLLGTKVAENADILLDLRARPAP